MTFFIYDKKYNVPIEFANVMINDKYSISDTIGKINIVSKSQQDTIIISHISYLPVKTSITKLKGLINNDKRIFLEPKIYNLKEITIKNSKKHFERIGWEAKKKWKYFTIRTKNGQSLTKINWSKKTGRVLDFRFKVDSLRGDSMLIKLNFYTNKGGKPFDYLVRDNIFYMIKPTTREVTIDLSQYNIRINDDFWVGLQGIESWDKKFWGYASFTMVKAFNGNTYYTWYRNFLSNEESVMKYKGESCGYNMLVEY